MGEVYLAEDTELERQVALKVLAAEVAEDDDRVRRFILEAKAASALNHPNILTVYEIGRHEISRYIATELIKGETLRGRLHGEPLTLRETLDVAMQVAVALNAAPRHKAGNIMLRDDGLVKVLFNGDAATWLQKMGAVAYRIQMINGPGQKSRTNLDIARPNESDMERSQSVH